MGFADAATLDFRMKAGAPVFQKMPGFQAIPFTKISLQTNDHRPTIPPREAKFFGQARRLDGRRAYLTGCHFTITPVRLPVVSALSEVKASGSPWG